MSPIDDFEVKYVALDHARSISARNEVVTVTDLLSNAKKIEKFIRDGIRD